METNDRARASSRLIVASEGIQQFDQCQSIIKTSTIQRRNRMVEKISRNKVSGVFVELLQSSLFMYVRAAR